MKYHILTYGCQMNKSDSERIAAVLGEIGYKKADSEKTADLFVLNACSVRQAAVDRIYGKINKIQKSKCKSQNDNSKFKIILTGCLLEKDREKIKPRVDLIFDINDLPKLPKFLEKIHNSKFLIRNSRLEDIPGQDYFLIQPKHSKKELAYVPIMTGCDNFCSYCAVPYTRGREKSRPAAEIIEEIKILVGRGAKEIILLGQNVNSYKSRTVNFPKLLKMICDLPGDFKIQFITAHPKDMTEETIGALKLPKISDSLHLPVQSGSNRILKLMNRHYTAGRYLKLIAKIRRAKPAVKISADIIVGFPGETARDFQKTVALCKKAGFAGAYVAQYSPRAGTLSAKIYADDVPPEEKKRRWRVVDDLANRTKNRPETRRFLPE